MFELKILASLRGKAEDITFQIWTNFYKFRVSIKSWHSFTNFVPSREQMSYRMGPNGLAEADISQSGMELDRSCPKETWRDFSSG
jgi:hypothetical protein